MFLPANMCKFCKQYFKCFCKWYVWKQPFKGFLQNSHQNLGILEEFPQWGELIITSKAAALMSTVLVEVGTFVDVLEVFCLIYYLLCERIFWGNCPQWFFHNFKYTFHFNLSSKESFLDCSVRSCIFDKYLVLIRYLIALAIQRGFLHR